MGLVSARHRASSSSRVCAVGKGDIGLKVLNRAIGLSLLGLLFFSGPKPKRSDDRGL